MERDSFIFYRSFWEALRQCPDDVRLQLYDAIADFALNFKKPDKLDGVAAIVFPLIEPQIAANNKRYVNGLKGKEFGALGGAPKGNQNAVKTTPKTNQNNPKDKQKQPQNNPKTTPNENVNVNENVNENVVIVPTAQQPPQRKTAKFVKPTIEEIRAYTTAKHYTFDAEAFFAYYESNGWKVGRNPMKDWRMACTTWQKKQNERNNNGNNQHPTDEQVIRNTYELIEELGTRTTYNDGNIPF